MAHSMRTISGWIKWSTLDSESGDSKNAEHYHTVYHLRNLAGTCRSFVYKYI